MLLTRLPLSPAALGPKAAVSWFSLDSHSLSTPPAFVLSQDQTLQSKTAGFPPGPMAPTVSPRTILIWPDSRYLVVKDRTAATSGENLLYTSKPRLSTPCRDFFSRPRIGVDAAPARRVQSTGGELTIVTPPRQGPVAKQALSDRLNGRVGAEGAAQLPGLAAGAAREARSPRALSPAPGGRQPEGVRCRSRTSAPVPSRAGTGRRSHPRAPSGRT